ncbi:DUF6585 family protein [Streptomyces sp. NPDC048483]|uniref:DUF6585 family protein n=1 Tax=Streptomyces sp. NPDC048483 TaxID=3154927 RepID=UPI00343568C5
MPRTRGEELLLARISAAAGRAHIGKRLATYAAAAHRTHAQAGPIRGIRVIRGLLAFARYGRPSARKPRADARLDLYDHGMTVAVKGRIHVVRYDTTSVFQETTRHPHGPARVGITRTYTLTDVEGKRIVLHGRPEDSDAEEWGPEIRRAVTHAQLPRAWAALGKGERLTFGDVWLTLEKVGSGEVSARWPQVQQIERKNGAIRLNIDGNWHRLRPTESKIPNSFVFCTLIERLRTDGLRS